MCLVLTYHYKSFIFDKYLMNLFYKNLTQWNC